MEDLDLPPPIIEFLGGAAHCPLAGLGPSGAGLPGYASPNNFPNNSGYRPTQTCAFNIRCYDIHRH